jgi:DNA replication protein DnaC
MSERQHLPESTPPTGDVEQHPADLKLAFIAEHYAPLANQAAQQHWSHVHYLAKLMQGEAALRKDRATKNRLRLARFPVVKTLDQFRWDWPTRINRLQVQNHFRLEFVRDKANLIYLGGAGLGKTHLATALGYTACLKGYSVLFASAIDVINTLSAAKSAGRLKQELKKYTKPALLILDEIGYLPIDKAGADLLFQVISLRYEQGAMIITSNRLCGAPHNRFNAELIVMRSPLFASPAKLLVRCILTPHKRAVPQRGDQFVGSLETSRAQFRSHNRF